MRFFSLTLSAVTRVTVACLATLLLSVSLLSASPAFAQGAPAAPTPPAAGQGVTPQGAQPGRLPEQVQSLLDRARAPYDQALALFARGGKDNLEAGIPLLREALTLLDAAVLVAGNIPVASEVEQVRDAVRQLLAEKEAAAKAGSAKEGPTRTPASTAQPASEADRRALYARVVGEIEHQLAEIAGKAARTFKTADVGGNKSSDELLNELRGTHGRFSETLLGELRAMFAIPQERPLESLNRVDEEAIERGWASVVDAGNAQGEGVLSRRHFAASDYLKLSWSRLAKQPELSEVWARRAISALLINDEAKAWQAGRALDLLKASEVQPSTEVVKAMLGLERADLHQLEAGKISHREQSPPTKPDAGGADKGTSGTAASATSPQLVVGSGAPILKGLKWHQGKPVDTFMNGHVYVLDFWAPWCGPCVRTIPVLSDIHSRYSAKNVHVVGIAVWPKSGHSVQEYVMKQGARMPYRVAEDNQAGSVAVAYLDAAGIKGIPCVMVVDKVGRIAWIGHPTSGLEQVVATVVAQPVAPIP